MISTIQQASNTSASLSSRAAEVSFTNLPRLVLTSTINSHKSECQETFSAHKKSFVEEEDINLNSDLKFDFSDSAIDSERAKKKAKSKKARSTSKPKKSKTDENIPTKL